jgi:hypothetical protein
MPPIPIYADAPITAAKADGVTPQTAPPPTRTTDLPATTTASNNSYPAAQPGAAAGPAPTGSASRPYAPAPAPTSTLSTSLQTDGPPPPQPGAAPVPYTHSNGYNPNSPAAPRAQPLPHQLNIPPPTTSALPTHSTTTATSPTSPSRRLPTTLPMGPVHSRPQSISTHPPGYQQNPYAAEMTSAQRASLEAAEAAEKGRKSGRNSISEWIAGEDDGFGSPAAGGTATAWIKGVASQASQWANKANEMASKKLG